MTKTNQLTKDALNAWAENATVDQLQEWETVLSDAKRAKRIQLHDACVEAIAHILHGAQADTGSMLWDNLRKQVAGRIKTLREGESQ